jgi:L-fucose isomerase-like protein
MEKDFAMRPRIGFVALGMAPWVVMENVEKLKNRALAELKKLPLDLFVVDGIPYTLNEIFEASRNLRREDVEVVLVYIPDYTSEELCCILARELSEYPFVLWSNWDSSESIVPILGIMATGGNLKRMGKKFFHVIGDFGRPETSNRIAELARAAAAARKLERSRIGVVGASNIGMLGTTYSEFHARRIAPGLVHLDTLELVLEMEKTTREEALQIARDLRSKVGRIEVDEKELILALRAYLAMKSVAARYRLDALAIRDWPELPKKDFSTGLGSVLLSEEGTVCVSEADLGSAMTWMILKLLTGKEAWMGELQRVNREENTAILVHYDPPLSLAETPSDITLTTSTMIDLYGGRKGGVSVQLPLKPGRVTIAKLSLRPDDDKIKMIVSSGEIIALRKIATFVGQSNAVVKLDPPIEKLIDIWIDEGFEHHMLLGYGDVRNELDALCQILGIEKILVA